MPAAAVPPECSPIGAEQGQRSSEQASLCSRDDVSTNQPRITKSRSPISRSNRLCASKVSVMGSTSYSAANCASSCARSVQAPSDSQSLVPVSFNWYIRLLPRCTTTVSSPSRCEITSALIDHPDIYAVSHLGCLRLTNTRCPYYTGQVTVIIIGTDSTDSCAYKLQTLVSSVQDIIRLQ